MTKSVRGIGVVLAPASVFATWDGQEPDAPQGHVGISSAGGTPIAVFHDPEASFAIPLDGTVLLVQSMFGAMPSAAQLAQLPTDNWKRREGTYTSDGGEHVLFCSMYSAAQYADEDMLEDIRADAGNPARISIPAGSYALEVYGMWSPEGGGEYALTRLVPSAAPKPNGSRSEASIKHTKRATGTVKKRAKKSAKRPAKKAAKKSAKEPAKKSANKPARRSAKKPVAKSATKSANKPAKRKGR